MNDQNDDENLPPPIQAFALNAAADYLGVSYNTLKRYVEDGMIGTITLPSKRKKITRDELIRVRSAIVSNDYEE